MRHRGHRLPSLRHLGGTGLGVSFQEIFSTDRLMDMAWAGGGGAAGGLVSRVAIPTLKKLPGLGMLPEEALAIAAGLVLGNLTYNWNRNFSTGIVAKLFGDAFASVLDRMDILPAALRAGTSGWSAGSFAQPSVELSPIRSDSVTTEPDQLAAYANGLTEVIPEGGIGGFGANVMSQQIQPGTSPSWEPNLAFMS